MTGLDRRMMVGGMLAAGVTGPVFGLRRQATGAWQAMAPLPLRVQEIYPGVLDGQIYLAGGLQAANGDNVDGISDRLVVQPDAADPASAWQDRARLPEPRHHPNLVGHDGFIHAIGGFRAGNGGIWEMLANTTRYDPASDQWTEMAPMPTPYAETCAVSLGGLIHVATGRQPNGEANANWPDHGDRGDHFAYDPVADNWSRRAPNPHPRNSAAGAVLNGHFHVVGGRRVNAGNQTHHEAYDPINDVWHSRAPLPQGQGGLAAAVVQGRLVAFGGEYFAEGGGVYPQVWIYDPEADTWSAGPDMLTPRHGLGGVALGDHVYAIGGASSASGRNTTSLVERLILAD